MRVLPCRLFLRVTRCSFLRPLPRGILLPDHGAGCALRLQLRYVLFGSVQCLHHVLGWDLRVRNRGRGVRCLSEREVQLRELWCGVLRVSGRHVRLGKWGNVLRDWVLKLSFGKVHERPRRLLELFLRLRGRLLP